MAFYRITLEHSYKSRKLMNVFHVEEETGLLTQEFVGLIIIGHWVPAFDGLQFTGQVLRFVEVRRILVPDPLAPTILEPNRICIGGGTGAEGNQAIKLLFRSFLAGKKHRGRYFVCGIHNSNFDVGPETLGPAALANVTNTVNTLEDKFAGGPNQTQLRLVIAHKDGSTPTRVSSVLFSITAHWLHSREPGHGI